MFYKTFALSVLFGLLFTAQAKPWDRRVYDHDYDKVSAVYFISNDVQNAIVSLKINEDGTLCDGSFTPTGGAGMSGYFGAPNVTAGPDSLFSQSPLTVVRNFVFAVNPGSNTLSMFSIAPWDSTKLTPIGSPVSTLGEFPMSVAAHHEHNTVCVANSGAKAGIACTKYSWRGLEPMDGLRPFDLGQTTPPIGPTNTVSQTFFSEDGTQLLTTVKGNPPFGTTGYLSSFPFDHDHVSMTGTKSSPAGTLVLFGAAKIPRSNDVLVTDASFGAVILSVSDVGIATTESSLKIAGQAATCWAAYSHASKSGFVADVAINRLVEVTNDGAVGRIFNSKNGNPGMTDLAAGGKIVYALSPGNATAETAVAVFDVVSGGQITELQNFKVKGEMKSAAGMVLV
ncbi:hypothetical protein K432DRAFT_425207 [Lepidopterella palustris CBS 459.81]|uniref:3-carboxymuconate cyclase n=1 Tax=Lepidopterella palustris CBS 459.81 TaxID=1314670 RepID=A0A8E2EC47_9PEZI|nr:hypothetical protein K432DRAFT_425207 [Lepidopterella palustris CBS 459.81]